jgi:Zn-dependent peptidase ImmA (M78 family)
MSTGTWGYLDEGLDSLDYFKSLEKDLNLELTKRTKYTLEELEKYTNVAHFFNYQEALDKGLLTKDIYDTKPQPRFKREEFVECIKDDLEHGMSIDDIVEAFEGDELYESEWDIVLDILAKVEKKVLEDEHLKEVEEVKKEIEEAESDEDDEVCEDEVEDIEVCEDEVEQFEEAETEVNNFYNVDEEDIVINEDDIECVDITFQEFITILDMHFDDVKHVLNGEYTSKEVANYLQENIVQFNKVDEQVLINYLILICTEVDDDE